MAMAFHDLLNRDLARTLSKRIREPAGAALREVVDDGVRVFERCSATGTTRARCHATCRWSASCQLKEFQGLFLSARDPGAKQLSKRERPFNQDRAEEALR